MLTQADALKQIVKSSTDVLHAGIDARNESVEIQAKLKEVNETLDEAGSVNGALPAMGSGAAAAEIEAKRQAAHAKIDSLAKTSLSKLNERTLAAIDGLPLHDQASAGHVGRPSAGGKAGRELVAGPNEGLPTRSAAAWGASVDTSLGSSGRHVGPHDSLGGGPSGGSGSAGGPVGGGASLQASHYAPPPSGAIVSSGSPAGVVGHSPAVHNPLASAAAITGGTGVAGYRAYQAARAARAVQTPAARSTVVRAAGAAPLASSSSRGIVRGATTAVRSPTASGRPAAAVRGGATGIARPASAASGRSAGIVRGATTAVRTPTTSAASAGQSGGRTPARGSGARVLTGGRTPTANGTGSSQRAGSSRGAGASRGVGSSSRGGLAARSASSVERTPTGQTGRGGATRTAAPARGQTLSSRLSQFGTRQTEAGNASRSGLRGARNGSSSRALSSLTGRPDKRTSAAGTVKHPRRFRPTRTIEP